MRKVRLHALKIDVPIGNNTFFDHGYVDNVTDYANSLIRKFKLGESAVDKNRRGSCLSFVMSKHTGYKSVHIFYSKSDNEATNWVTRGHEETHALEILGRKQFLALDMLKGGYYSSALQVLRKSGEELADMGGLHALLKQIVIKF